MPKETIAILNKLKSHGFSNEHFMLLHHFERETMESMIAYCEGIGSFQNEQNNQRVKLRLDIVFMLFKSGHFSIPPKSGVFYHLCMAALAEIPKK